MKAVFMNHHFPDGSCVDPRPWHSWPLVLPQSKGLDLFRKATPYARQCGYHFRGLTRKFSRESGERSFSTETIKQFLASSSSSSSFNYFTLAKMLLSKFLGLTLTIGMSAAQSTTVSLFLPDTDPQSLVASVVGAVSHAGLTTASFVQQLTCLSPRMQQQRPT
jgi:hypothetical protein